MAIADLNGDGMPDLVTANSGSDTVSVLRGNRDGTFQPAQTFAVGDAPESVAVADLNRDRMPDLVTANERLQHRVGVAGQLATAPSRRPSPLPLGPALQSVAVADLNRDGIPDLVTANYDSNTVSVLLGNGNGTFQAAQAFAVGSGPSFVAIADLNRDGVPDLVTANELSDTVSVLLGNGDGTFQAAQPFAVGDQTSICGRRRPQRRWHPRSRHRQSRFQ